MNQWAIFCVCASRNFVKFFNQIDQDDKKFLHLNSKDYIKFSECREVMMI